MDPIQSTDHRLMRAAHEAPRCQHIRYNGQRCAAPALRGQSHCHFHARIQPRALQSQDIDPDLPFIEDATSLQFVLMRVLRMLNTGYADRRVCALMLYALQIACANLKNFMAEHPRPEVAEGERPQPKLVSVEKQKPAASLNGDPPSLAEFLLGLLTKGENEGPDAPPSIRNREDYEAVEQREGPTAALPAKPEAVR